VTRDNPTAIMAPIKSSSCTLALGPNDNCRVSPSFDGYRVTSGHDSRVK